MEKVPVRTLYSTVVTYVSLCERGIIFLRVSCDETTAQTGDATRRDLPPTRVAANSGVLHLSIRPVVRLANRGIA